MIDTALLRLRPNAQWVLTGDTYDGLEWLDPDQTKPSPEEIAQEIASLQAEAESTAHQELRREAYPSIAEQLDLLYHSGYAGWRNKITEVKARFPKPE